MDGTLGLAPQATTVSALNLANSTVSFAFDGDEANVQFGGTDDDDYEGDLVYFTGQSSSYWTVSASNAYYGGADIHSAGATKALVSTADPRILLPQSDFNAFVNQIKTDYYADVYC